MEQKIATFSKKDSKDEKIDRALLCFICKMDFEDKPKSFLPCFHAAHTNCLKTRMIKNPMNYPCTVCKKNPNESSEKDPSAFVENLLDDKFLKEFYDKKSLAVINQNLKNWGQCNAKFMIDPSNPNYEEKNGGGEYISIEAADCKANNRIKCSDCKKESWVGWNACPFHNFMTCEQYLKSQDTVKCRYWDSDIEESAEHQLHKTHNCCNKEECIQLNILACHKTLECGHLCNGCAKSETHMTCLYPEWVEKNEEPSNGINHEEGCAICMEEIKTRPSILCKCKHIFDIECILSRLQAKWSTANIDFTHLNCWCNTPIETDHPEIEKIIQEDRELEEKVKIVAVEAAQKDGLDKDDFSGAPFNNDFEKYAVHKVAVFQCYDCGKPYSAGLKDCGAPNFKKEDCFWGDCSNEKLGETQGVTKCQIHGTDLIVYKCKYCCNEASFFCWGTTHFCGDCHEIQEEDPEFELSKPEELSQCGGAQKCPLKIQHPPNGTVEFSIRWGGCEQ